MRPEKPVRPATPACVDEARRRHTCSARVIRDYDAAMDRYEAAFNAHVDQVNGYVEALNRYVVAVNDYAACERKAIMPEGSVIRG